MSNRNTLVLDTGSRIEWGPSAGKCELYIAHRHPTEESLLSGANFAVTLAAESVGVEFKLTARPRWNRVGPMLWRLDSRFNGYSNDPQPNVVLRRDTDGMRLILGYFATMNAEVRHMARHSILHYLREQAGLAFGQEEEPIDHELVGLEGREQFFLPFSSIRRAQLPSLDLEVLFELPANA